MTKNLRLSALTQAVVYATRDCTCDPEVIVSGQIVEVEHDSDCGRAEQHELGIVALRDSQ